MYNRPSWDTLYMSMCYLLAYKSEDDSTKVGAVLATKDHSPVAYGFNGLPRGLTLEPQHLERPGKYYYFEHAERNAVYNASRAGVDAQLAHTLYITWLPCAPCARAVIQGTGVKEIVVHRQGQDAYMSAIGTRHDNWADSNTAACEMFDARGIDVRWYEGPIIAGLQGFFSGKLFDFDKFDYESNL